MADITQFTKQQLLELKKELYEKYNKYKSLNLSLNMSRGKPSGSQLNITNGILAKLDSYITQDGVDARNYGVLEGITEIREIFAELLNLDKDNIIIGGNSSLNLIYDTFARFMLFGTLGSIPWSKLPKIKFLCPSPGYDRHFSICEEFSIEMIPIPMLETGPDMDMIEKLVKEDESIKGMICIPLYSNPDGTCYSDETVTRIAKMKTAASDFRLIWDNAYGVHHIYSENKILNIFEEAKKYGNEDRIFYYFSTSKITFPGSGVAFISASQKNIAEVKKHMSIQTIGHDKLNQLRIVKYFKNADGIRNHMKKQALELIPKFDLVLNKLEEEFKNKKLLKWTNPKGGYFISVNTMDGCAKETVKLAKEAGVTLTGAGSAYPYKHDPHDRNIRIAPTYPELDELEKAIEIFCICVKIASVDKLLENL